MRRDYSATTEARRYVARCVADMIDPANGHENAFIVDGAERNGATRRRRRIALDRLVLRLRRESLQPPAGAPKETR